MLGFKMAHNEILSVFYTYSFHILFCEFSHELIGQTGRIYLVETYGDMTRRVLFAGHKSVYHFKRLHHFGIVGGEYIFASDDAPCVWRVLFRVVF